MVRRLPAVLAVVLGLSLAVGAFGEDDPRVTELQTAGYYELVARATELGLATTGSVADLRARVAQSLGVTLPPDAPPGAKTLTIDSAREAGLVTVDAPGDGKLLRLSGGLQVTLVDLEKKVTHIVKADELWYDQAHEEMTARGNVVYTMVRETTKEVFRGESLTFRLSDSEGVFYDGASERPRTVGTQTITFRYSGEAIRRSSDDMVILESGTITSSLGADPYYRIKASKIWVLAPGEWGLQDAVLYLGRVPVLYFPFFFQPGDDFFFNPVLSFPDSSDRRGTSLQTTTYFWGKKTKAQSGFSFLQMADTADTEARAVKGLFLVRASQTKDPKASAVVPSDWVLKYQADFYSNLGFITGVDLSVPGAWNLKTLSAFLGLARTRTVSSAGVPFSSNPFRAELDPWSQSDWNSSWVGSTKLPFRWGGRFNVDAGWGSLGIEYYSDPLLYNDMTANRSENFSVFSLVGLGTTKTTSTATAKTSLTWTGALNVAPASVGASLLWSSSGTTTAVSSGNPNDSFYYPSQMTLPQLTLSFAGTLWPPTAAPASTPTAATTPATTPASTHPAATSADLVPPGDQPSEATPTGSPAPADADPASSPALVAPTTLEALTLAAADPTWTSGVSWSLTPTVKTDTRFNSTVPASASDNGWNVSTSRWIGSYDAKLNLSTGWSDGLWTATETFSLHQQAQDTWYQSSKVDATTQAANKLLDDQQTSGLLTQSLGATLKPFVSGGAWRESTAQYTLTSNLWQDTYTGTVWADTTTKTITTHQVSTQAVVYLLDGTPSLKSQTGLVSTLPPLDPLKTYSQALTFTVPWGSASSTVTAKQTNTALTWDPWETVAEWKPTKDLSLKETYQYDLGHSYPLLSTSLLSAYGATVQYRHQRTTPYTFDTATRLWVAGSTQAFVPQQLQFTYALNLPSIQWWYYRNTLSSTVNFSWPINLQKYSDMPLSLTYTLGYKLARFLDFSITGGVVNKTAFRYFPNLVRSFGSSSLTVVNPLTDLWDSVSVWNHAALLRTGFKMTTLTIGLVHYLDDWQIKADYSGTPTLNTAGTQYDWVGTFSLLVSWNPIPELKTQLNVDKNGQLTIAKNDGTTTTTTSN